MTETGHDQVMPEGKWEFGAEVTDVFDDMLKRSIPQYAVMRKAVFDLAQHYVQPGLQILDIGCSRGEALAPFVEKYGNWSKYLGLEISEPMVAAARRRFEGVLDASLLEIRHHDLRTGLPRTKATLVLSVLTLMFVPMEHRQKVMAEIYETLVPGGALILVEKLLGGTAEIDAAMVEIYYDMKRAEGYTEEQILRKKLSLEGVLVPMTAAWNEDLLERTGFKKVDCFWRWMNFGAWVAIK